VLQDWDFIGVSLGCGQMFVWWFWGRLRGAIAENTKPLLCGYCNMFFVAKVGQTLDFLAGNTGVVRVLVQMFGL
jgi:hypothetical protein